MTGWILNWRPRRSVVVLGTVAALITTVLPATVALASQGELVRVSVSSSGVQANGFSSAAEISGDGRYVLFASSASNLVTGDTNGRSDFFRFDRFTGQVHPVSVTASGLFVEAVHSSAEMSDDGRFVAFWSDASFDTADPLRTADVIFKDMLTGVVERVSRAPDGSNKIGEDRLNGRETLAISGDGRWVAYNSVATNLVAGDTEDSQPDTFLRDRVIGVTTLLSSEPGGVPGPSFGLEVVISGSGSSADAAFSVQTPELGVTRQVIRLLESGVETVVEGLVGARSTFLAVAPGGGFAIIASGTGTAPSEYEVATGQLTLLPDNVDWTQAVPQSFSADLRHYAVADAATFTFEVFDRDTETLTELPHSSTGASPDGDVLIPSISDDGIYVAFSSLATNLVATDTNAVEDAFYVRVGLGTFADDDGSIFEADIEWLFEQGITFGCAVDLFCPKAPVTREQMASFLVRALDLPFSTTDAFTDDDGSLHQADINALAAAGITQGCGGTNYCPKSPVSRQEMASFLVRALDLPAATLDYFTDDAGSIHEADNNSLALAEITLGCEPSLFCPTATVLREQMAAFLHRALG